MYSGHPNYNAKLAELRRIQTGNQTDSEMENFVEELDTDFASDAKEFGFTESDLKVRVAILQEIIMHNVANGTRMTTTELANLCEMKYRQLHS